ncbi:MAG: reverse transcriptase family protein, partial [Solirubrobacteraceae bacterium]
RWTEDAMVRRARRALEGPARWLRPLVREVLATYPRPPADRPRELAAYVEIVLGEPAFGAPPPPRVRRHPVGFTPRMARMPWPVPAIPTLGALSDFLDTNAATLEWLADARGLEHRAADERLRNYRYTWVARRSGPPRLIEAPKARLKVLQRRVLREILAHIPPHDAAHGFVAGRSARSHAARHAGRAVVLCLDLEDFFVSVAPGRLFGVLRTAGYPEAVAHGLTALCTNATPVDVVAAAPFTLRRRLAHTHLPQGAPTSPALANLVAFALDRRLAGLAARAGATYSRYADDLTFSGGPRVHASLAWLRANVERIVRDEGFRLNTSKTRYMTAAGRQHVTGIVVNVHPNVAREEYDALKALLHEAERRGLAAANRANVPDLRAHVLGRISWIGALNAARGARLRERFDRIAWE